MAAHYAQALCGAGSLEERVTRLARLRSAEGYMAESPVARTDATSSPRTIARSAPPPRVARAFAARSLRCSRGFWRRRGWNASNICSRRPAVQLSGDAGRSLTGDAAPWTMLRNRWTSGSGARAAPHAGLWRRLRPVRAGARRGVVPVRRVGPPGAGFHLRPDERDPRPFASGDRRDGARGGGDGWTTCSRRCCASRWWSWPRRWPGWCPTCRG